MLSSKSILRPKIFKFVRYFSYSEKFPESTVPGVLKHARSNNEWKDCVRFDSQNYNFTIKELDDYTSAFAYGLVENGYKPGDKLMLWVDQESSAEIATAQIGAFKAGVSIVTVGNNDDADHIASTLEKTGSKGLMLSPHTKTDGTNQRANLLLDILPELVSSYPGQDITFRDFPNLKHVVHTGHVSIRGTTKFKENMLYTKKSLTNFRIPGCNSTDLALECFSKGKLLESYTHKDITSKADELWRKYLNTDDKIHPVFLTVSLKYPLGLATLIACTQNGRKVFIPSTYNIAKIAKSFSHQKSDVLVCEEDVFSFEPPVHKYDEVKESISHFKKALVAGEAGETDTHIFTGLSATHTNFYLQ